MRDELGLFQLTGETSASINPLARDILGPLFEKHFAEQRFYQPTFLAYNLLPKLLTAALFCQRTPYFNPVAVDNLLQDTVKAGYLELSGKDSYTVSLKGKTAIEDVHESFYSRINEVNKFPSDKIKKLIDLLGKLVESCNKADFVTGIFCLESSHHGHPRVENGTLAQADQLLDDLNAFRDDAHISAWTPVGVSGHAWEVLSFVWNGEANTVEKLVERLPFRQYSAEDFYNTLEDLTQRGWIKPGSDGYTMTEKGQKLRDDGEADTNTNFLGPWKVLSDDELVQLEQLLTGLKETNRKLVEENQDE